MQYLCYMQHCMSANVIPLRDHITADNFEVRRRKSSQASFGFYLRNVAYNIHKKSFCIMYCHVVLMQHANLCRITPVNGPQRPNA